MQTMSIRDWLFHKHYWGSPHSRAGDQLIIQICYECGKQRELLVDLRPKLNQPSGEEHHPYDLPAK
jgi:hypothetical protein